ncbi:type II secretion system protein GspM [Ferrimonas sp. SCSIO 43195]|uniref:type II secretion system protein GspM n=1 Tax=Ferrimonas sp. SCSIO 43195 TaxID=2822844 RepID=UPI002074FA3D|nr:type II secretion system protein GspM [Ferrimonas sp. SCSIO 43195]USD37284.1 type II secretion system protein M [Ferrimonas sp. SCSIO 43195]
MNRIEKLRSQFDALSVRERGLIFGGGLVVLAMLLFTLLVEPMWLKLQQNQSSIGSIEAQLPAYQAQVMELNDQLASDLDEANRLKMDELSEQIAQEQSKLGERVIGLILPEQMPTVLAQMLTSAAQVELVSLVSNPAEPLSPASSLYQHGLTLTLKGEYFGLMKVLAKMEALPQQFYWQKVDYQVEEYPMAIMTLDIYTLGTEKELIRVGTRLRSDTELFSVN